VAALLARMAAVDPHDTEGYSQSRPSRDLSRAETFRFSQKKLRANLASYQALATSYRDNGRRFDAQKGGRHLGDHKGTGRRFVSTRYD